MAVSTEATFGNQAMHERQVRRFSPGAPPPVGVAAAERRSPEPGKPLWKHDVVIIDLGGGAAGGVGAASSAAAVTVTNKNTVTTLTTVTPAAGALVTAPPALATGGAAAPPAVNAGLNATTSVLAGAGTATGASPVAPTAPPGALPVTAGAARVSGFGEGAVGSVAMLLLAGVAGAMVMA
ncbi:uncharacterized protein PG986_011819 [Apiospora aurea]|uniref:Uncharacterized protein n=1 Tax=Apiospora aurea TaxID=335848 RepID=A0ABR1PY89_9PEZI